MILLRLHDEDNGAAKVDVVQIPSVPASYSYLCNPNICLVDLPGIGTPTFPDLYTYCQKIELETYDMFLILAGERFTRYDLEIAQKIRSMGKSFFLIRTKLDQEEVNENRRKRPDIRARVKIIRRYLYENTKELGIGEDKIFLVSNYQKNKWDFSRLVAAVLEQLCINQKVSQGMNYLN